METVALPLQKLIEHFRRMPGVGAKTAQRMALFVLSETPDEVRDFAACLTDAVEKLRRCPVCCNLTDREICPVCESPQRSRKTVCVVENTEALLAMEKTNEYNGTYHVLHGVISPLDEIGPEDLTVKELLHRIDADGVTEVIMATGSGVEGELTAMYLSKLLKPLGVKVTRLAYGLPVGSDLQYADAVTLSRALEGRREL
ncbi:MAG: recombination protein RecR [Clostridia bacterium]|jgi:recombination protein RecR|nr:recombination protein RecR [Clostridia bacterium]